MKTPVHPRSLNRNLTLALLVSGAALGLSGCGGMSTGFPDSVVTTQVQTPPPIRGSVFGGHAPIVGSHVYLLQPGTAGIGSIATSILGTGTSLSSGSPLFTNPATGGDPHIPAGWQYVISDSSGGFNVTGEYTCAAGQPVYLYSWGGNPGTVNNTAISQMAILGNCPTSGALNFGGSSNEPINFVYMNEVSTVAAAYVFQPFTVAANNDAVHIGSSGTTQGLIGIENAANTAAQLYSIQGNGQISTANDGEGHIANYQTQSISFGSSGVTFTPNAGNGVVPQATIDTLANILASCIDGPTGAASATCITLFANATNDGTTTGTNPTDTATAGINIARYPAGNYSGTVKPTNFVSNIYALQTGIVPFVPKLNNQPNDFTIVINYPYTAVSGYPSASNSTLGRAESIAVDEFGQIWITAQAAHNYVRWSPLGIQNAGSSSAGGYIYGYISIDGSNNAWTGNANSITGIQFAGSNGVFTTTYGQGYNTAYTVITDKSGNAYFFASNAGSPNAEYNTYNDYQMWVYNSTGTLTSTTPGRCGNKQGPFLYYCTGAGFILNSGDNVAHGAIESAAKGGYLWVTSERSPYQIARITPTGGLGFTFSSNLQQPEFPSIDRNGDAWIANQAATGSIYKFAIQGTAPYYNYTTLTSASTGANLTWTFGSAVDGNNNVWFANRCGGYGACTNTTGTNSIVQINGSNNLAISPPTNYIPEAQYPATATSFTKMLNDSLNLAIDPSGNVWVTNYIGNSVAELVGAAAPVVTPLSLAAGNNALGVAP